LIHLVSAVISSSGSYPMFLDPARVVHREEQLLVINLRGLPKKRLKSWDGASDVMWESIKISQWHLGVYDVAGQRLVGFLRPKGGSKGFGARLSGHMFYELEFFGLLADAANQVLRWAQSQQQNHQSP
jgi:hypothetical protein